MMEPVPDNEKQQAEETAPLSVGSTLRDARERMGLAVEDVVNRLKFAPRQVQALEADAFDQLPEGAFLRGFVRSYARLLQVDEAPLLEALPEAYIQEATPVVRQSVEVPFPGVYSMRRSNIAWLAAALVVALALGLFTWLHGHRPLIRVEQPVAQPAPQPLALPASAVAAAPAPVQAHESAPTHVAAPARVDASPAAEPAAEQPKVKFHVSAGTGPIRMVFDADSWVEVKDKDGNLLMSQVNTAGSEQYLDGNPPFALTIGHASGVKLYYKGKQIDLAPLTNSEVAHVTLE